MLSNKYMYMDTYILIYLQFEHEAFSTNKQLPIYSIQLSINLLR